MVLRDDLIRVTRAGAQAAYKWFGRGDKVAADEEAVKAMREAFGSVAFNGEVIIGEGE